MALDASPALALPDRAVIDAHVHAFPPDVIRDRDRLVGRDNWFGQLYANPAAKLTSDVELAASMNACGVERSLMCGFPWSDMGLCRVNNDWMAEVSAASSGRLPWLAAVVPQDRDAAAELRRCLDLGASGIGELNMDAQGFDLAEPDTLSAFTDACWAFDCPVLLHTSEPVGHDYLGKGAATPDRVLAFLAKNRDLRVVLAHWGGGLPFYELMPEVAELCRNVVYDTAASPYLFRQRIFDVAPTLVGTDRILWASDFPVLGQQRFLDRVHRHGLGDQDLSRIVRHNALRTYALPATLPERDPT